MMGDGRRWPGVAQDCIQQGQAQNNNRSTDQQMLRDAPAERRQAVVKDLTGITIEIRTR